jgi:hypothetical protein
VAGGLSKRASASPAWSGEKLSRRDSDLIRNFQASRNLHKRPAFTAQFGSRLNGRACEVSVVLKLNNQISLLEICSEQVRIHLRSIDRTAMEAEKVRSDLLIMLQKLVALKGQGQRLEASLHLEAAA